MNKIPEIKRPVRIWLFIGLVMVFFQVIIGGVTRLTDSGLSITEWAVIQGTLPPMNQTEWNEAFELYKEGMELEVFIEKGILSRFTYNNVVISGLLLKEFQWVEAFIYDFKNYIEERFRESTFNYNLANLYFRKPDYPKAMELLQRVEFDDVMHNLNARRMLLKIYFESEEFDALDSHLTSFKNYIYRHKELGGSHRNSYLNLIKFTNKLLNVNLLDDFEFDKIKLEIEMTEPVAEKNWLLGILSKTPQLQS